MVMKHVQIRGCCSNPYVSFSCRPNIRSLIVVLSVSGMIGLSPTPSSGGGPSDFPFLASNYSILDQLYNASPPDRVTFGRPL